jgi:uncharacterized membrane protein
MAWLLPTLGYVVVLGIWGVTGKLALRTLSWQDVLLITAVVYVVVATGLVLLGQANFHADSNNWWALASAACVVSALIFIYIALGTGEVSKVIPVSAAYPALAMALSAVFLSESLTTGKVIGALIVVGGVVLISVSD